jgi:hypothetical protein
MADLACSVHVCECVTCSLVSDPDVVDHHAAVNAIAASLDERHRRLFAALLASEHGRGGITLLAQVTGLSRTTLLRGQRELHDGLPADPSRVRKPGGGRPRAEKKARTS